MPGHNIITIGTSAGGVEALVKLVRQLPRDLPAAVFVVLHIPAQGASLLPEILNRWGELKAMHATDNMEIQQGYIYVAPPDHHLLLEQGHMHIVRGPKENHYRPSVDALFRSAAITYGPRVIGVVLTGPLMMARLDCWLSSNVGEQQSFRTLMTRFVPICRQMLSLMSW
jgi:two-component system chemotaxis response regulator CheB